MKKDMCPFKEGSNCNLYCEFYEEKELKTKRGKSTHCTINVAVSVINELNPEAINALCKVVEDKKE